MKTKLLKIIRKRFSIEYIESPPNYDCLIRDYFETYKQPYYLLMDYLSVSYPFKTKEEAFEEMTLRIFNDYAYKFPKRRTYKHNKIWWDETIYKDSILNLIK